MPNLFITFILTNMFSLSVHATSDNLETYINQGAGVSTGIGSSTVVSDDASNGGECDNCAIMAGRNAFADCTNPKCRDSIMRGAFPDATTGKDSITDPKGKAK
jgi:hypothetical protein